MSDYLKKVRDASEVNRRGFIKASAALAALITTGAMAGCANSVTESESIAQETTASDDLTGGKWVTAACWHNCGGRCLNKAYVKDGVVLRQKTDDNHEDSPDYPQQRGCLRGRAQRKQVFAADRLKYPMRRKHWSFEEPHGELRGTDEWERITWDEALDSISQGIKTSVEKYGNKSLLLCGGWNSNITDIARPLGLFGGYTETWNTNSFGSWVKSPFVIGFNNGGIWDQTINDRFDLRNCDTIVMMSMNPSWSAMGSQTLNYLEAKKNGAKFIALDPFYNDTYALLEADWLPVRPTTDMSLMLGLAYAMLDQDTEKELIDWDFLHRCTVGFDEESMPEGADKKDCFKDYVLGTYDGTPKTPEWASEICGVEPDEIRDLAEKIGKKNKVAILCGMASSRVHNVDNLPQLVMTIGAMGGHMGKSGHMTGSTMHATSGNGGPALIKAGSNGLPAIPNPVDDSINANDLWNAVLGEPYNWTGAGSQAGKNQFGPGEERKADIHVIYHAFGALLQTNDGMTKGIEAHRKVDMVVSQGHFFTTNARYSDIVLPATTEWEKFGGFTGGTLVHSSNREMMVAYEQVVDPLYEAKSDQWIATELGKKLGLNEEDLYPFGIEQQYYNALSTMTTVDDNGLDYVPAVSITADDIETMGVDGTPQDGKLAYQELKKRGVYQVERHPDDNLGYIAFEDFRKDPEANPVDSETGKLEIYSKRLADMVNAMGNSEIKPIPTYIKVDDGYMGTFANGESGEKGEFPFQVINLHYLRRAHTVFDNIPWLREAWTNPAFISSVDANVAGVIDGDTILITSGHGKTIRRASVTGRMRPGVVGLPHGAWVKVDEDTGIDQAGADNILTGQHQTGQGVSGYNSVLCKIEKYTGPALGADVDEPLRLALKDGE